MSPWSLAHFPHVVNEPVRLLFISGWYYSRVLRWPGCATSVFVVCVYFMYTYNLHSFFFPACPYFLGTAMLHIVKTCRKLLLCSHWEHILSWVAL